VDTKENAMQAMVLNKLRTHLAYYQTEYSRREWLASARFTKTDRIDIMTHWSFPAGGSC